MELIQQTKQTTLFTLNGFKTEAKVVHVYDGDTIHIVFKYFDNFYKWNCRISHVDTPELRTKNEEEKRKGYEVRDKLRELILDKIVNVQCLEFDKYGRLLIELYIGDIYVNQWLIDNNLAKQYEGGTKENW
jgi:micrococcal nuclease